jgi:hypothetical protein
MAMREGIETISVRSWNVTGTELLAYMNTNQDRPTTATRIGQIPSSPTNTNQTMGENFRKLSTRPSISPKLTPRDSTPIEHGKQLEQGSTRRTNPSNSKSQSKVYYQGKYAIKSSAFGLG